MSAPGSSRRQFSLAFTHQPSFSGENYLVAEPNRHAWQWLQRWPNWPSPALAIHGPVGCGKTHLAQMFLYRSQGILLTPALMIQEPATDLAADARVVIIDDADQLIAAGVEAPLLHLYNDLAEHGRSLLLTAEEPPARWPICLPDLRSRLSAIPAIGIAPPDDDLMAALLVKLFADRQLKVDDEVVLYLLPRIERSFEAARRLVAEMDAAMLATRRKITLALAREVLRTGSGNARE